MKKIIQIILLLPLFSRAQSHDQYLVTKSNDTIFYKGDLVVNNNQVSKWRKITADSVEYAVSEIKSAYFNHSFYVNCDGRHLYKQVINGKINVYALNDKDTIADRHGNLRRDVFIEKSNGRKPVLFTLRNLLPMIADNDSLAFQMKEMNGKRHGGTAMIVSGICIGAPTIVIGLLGAAVSSIFSNDSTEPNRWLAAAGAGAFVGGGLIGGGAALKAGTKNINLNTIHWYNAN